MAFETPPFHPPPTVSGLNVYREGSTQTDQASRPGDEAGAIAKPATPTPEGSCGAQAEISCLQDEMPPPIPRRSILRSALHDCEGCGQPITGKATASTDGKLQGRYHKACLTCTVCRAQVFSPNSKTQDVYVLDRRLYCSRDYHENNGSKCGFCGNGIEGHYREDALGGKYHPNCWDCWLRGRMWKELPALPKF